MSKGGGSGISVPLAAMLDTPGMGSYAATQAPPTQLVDGAPLM